MPSKEIRFWNTIRNFFWEFSARTGQKVKNNKFCLQRYFNMLIPFFKRYCRVWLLFECIKGALGSAFIQDVAICHGKVALIGSRVFHPRTQTNQKVMFTMLGKFLRSMPHRLSGLKLSNLSLYKACPMHAGRWHLPPCTSFWMHDNGRLTHCRVIETLGLERCIAAMAILDIYRSITVDPNARMWCTGGFSSLPAK